jgi:uncharacterized protein (DUF2141 family)
MEFPMKRRHFLALAVAGMAATAARGANAHGTLRVAVIGHPGRGNELLLSLYDEP